MISPNILNKLVTLERPFIVVDESSGARAQSWEPVLESIDVPCSIQPITSKVQMALASRQIIVTHFIYTLKDLKPSRGDRLVSGGVHYLITGFYNLAGRNRIYLIEGREVTS